MFKAIIHVTLRENVLDPQGVAVRGSLHALGYNAVEEVRIGKRMELVLNCKEKEEAKRQVQEICEKLLANPVIENFDYRLEEVAR